MFFYPLNAARQGRITSVSSRLQSICIRIRMDLDLLSRSLCNTWSNPRFARYLCPNYKKRRPLPLDSLPTLPSHVSHKCAFSLVLLPPPPPLIPAWLQPLLQRCRRRRFYYHIRTYCAEQGMKRALFLSSTRYGSLSGPASASAAAC